MSRIEVLLYLYVIAAVRSGECVDGTHTSPNDEQLAAFIEERPRQASNDGGLFGHFKHIDHDLEESYLPNQIAGRLEVIAMPPHKEKGKRLCPQCLSSPPEIFPKLYCSSKLSAKINFLDRYQLDVLEDMSPDSSGMVKHNRVTYTMKRRCTCDLLESGRATALMVVTPPRTFNLRSIQLIHLDDSITLLPWNITEPILRGLPKSSSECYRMLIAS